MSHCVSNMIGIRTGGVFSGASDMTEIKSRIIGIVKEMDEGEFPTDIYTGNDGTLCISNELIAHKGSYVVIAGVFNYWGLDRASEFAKKLSSEFVTEVMYMSWDEVRDEIQCQIFLDGRPLFEVEENPIGRIMRRVS